MARFLQGLAIVGIVGIVGMLAYRLVSALYLAEGWQQGMVAYLFLFGVVVMWSGKR